MKKTLLRLSIFLCFYSLGSVKAQWVSIPDTAFGAWLNAYGYSTCLQGNNAVGWEMDTTCNAVMNETRVNCSNQIHLKDLTGIQYFVNLDTLICNYDSLNTLPPLPAGLTYFDCSFSKITTLPDLPAGLTDFDCTFNQLTTLPALPAGITNLRCGFNQLITLPTLPAGLTYLYCYYNRLTTLPALPIGLYYISCHYNRLITLPDLPVGLQGLDCNNNHLTSLPSLPAGFKGLYCNNNELTSLPALPAGLTSLECHDNELTSLPVLPTGLTSLECHDNYLTTIPELPDSLTYFHCHNNSNLTCLPRLKKIGEFWFYNTAITCLPNYPQSNYSSNPQLSSMPVCYVLNPNGCAAFSNIAGTVYIDSNASRSYNAGVNGFAGAKVQLYQSGVLQQQTFSINGGSFSFDTDLSDYSFSIDTINMPLYIACPDTSYYTASVTVADSFITGKDFGFRCKPGFDLVAQSIEGRFRQGNTRQLKISAGDFSNFYNAHCAAGISGTVQLVMSGSATYVSPASGALAPTNVSGDTVMWNIPDFGAVNFFSDFNINVATDTTAVLGSQICFTLIVNPIATDNSPANNVLDYCGTVVGSFDPNEKEVYPAGNIDTAQKWLTYTIHFQNTGTDTAQHIYITDTLSQYVDESSFQLLAYSHQPMVQIKENAVRFNFPNINLPDSNTNELLSRGYVQYKVKFKDNLPLGTNISNTAFIYFDFNSAVVTNTVSNTISTVANVAEFGMQNSE